MRLKLWSVATLILLASVVVIAQQGNRQQTRTMDGVAVIFPTEGSKVSGVVHFTQTDQGLHVVGEVSGLAPNSKHGFHIHEFGDMTVKDGTGMGGHFNPNENQHGLPDQAMRHAGDMGNIEADANGVAKIDKTFMGVNLAGRNGALGRGVIVHDKPDDGGQPTGNAGGRIGYGVVGIAKAAS